MHKLSLIAAFAALAGTAAAQAQGACSSDGQRPPVALLERFISADCEKCWADKSVAPAAAGALALDWIVPTSRGDDAPLSAAATRDALERLKAQGAAEPVGHQTRTARALPMGRLRVAHGLPVNDYIGTSIEWREMTGDGPWTAWVVLVESLPAGAEGSPVARNVVRNALQLAWRKPAGGPLRELRAMRIPDGAKPERLAVVGWVQDERGGLRAIARTHCAR